MTRRWLKLQVAIIVCMTIATACMSAALIMSKDLITAFAFVCLAFSLYVEVRKYLYWRRQT